MADSLPLTADAANSSTVEQTPSCKLEPPTSSTGQSLDALFNNLLEEAGLRGTQVGSSCARYCRDVCIANGEPCCIIDFNTCGCC